MAQTSIASVNTNRVRKISIVSASIDFLSTYPVSIKYGLRTADYGLRTTDYGLGIKHGLRYKTRTKHYGLGIKYGLGYKTRTEHYGLGIKHEERFYIV